ncbi:right-handed parallel beta-helix repeat-containing protein [Paenibacillus paridis]|uniref:right-handed parallel beta-helix repeat-containing protein n=1 Tax=Paenibacillus paridis TaxID=2583376 RepID=UPI00112112F8|nr:right-handed parallel beta-helix repeat-containing protein [Paenibacillus paridis]
MDRNFYVAMDGNDKQSGSTNAPFRTIGRAREHVREYIEHGMDHNVNVYIRGGLYEQEAALRFDDRDGGKDGFWVRYSAFPGEEAVIAGGKKITGWTVFKGNIWAAKLDSGLTFHTLYAEGARVKQARLPASGYYETDLSSTASNEQEARQGLFMREKDMPLEQDLSGTQVFVWPGEGEWNWFSELKSVAAVNRTERFAQFESSSTWPIGAGSRYYIQGHLSFLQSPGQYYFDQGESTLYYWPANDHADPNKQTVIAPMVTRLLDINGRSPEQTVRSLSFSRLTLACTDFFPEYRMMDDNVEQTEHREGLIYINHAEDIQIESCQIGFAGSCAIFLDHYAKSIAIEGNDINQFGYIGISLNGFAPGAGPFEYPEASYTNSHNRIANNHIQQGGELVGHGCGILLYQSGNNQITNNLIADLPRYGISMKGLRHKTMPSKLYGIDVTWDNHWAFLHSRNNLIAYNDISRVMTDSQDGGLIEAWGVGRGNVIDSNYLHDSGIHFSFGFGIYLDDAADDFTVTNNIITRLYSSGSGKLWMLIFAKGIGNRISNNLLVSNPDAIAAIGSQEMADEENKHIEIAGNIIYNSGYLYYFVNYSEERFAAADRNLYFRNGKPCLIGGCLPLPDRGDDPLGRKEYGFQEWRSISNGKYDKNTVFSDPLFIDAEMADYRLRPESPAYRLGWSSIDFSKIGPK